MHDPTLPAVPRPPVPPTAPVAPVAPGAPPPAPPSAPPPLAPPPTPPPLAPPPTVTGGPAPAVYDERYVRSTQPAPAVSHTEVVVGSSIAAAAGALLFAVGLQFADDVVGRAETFNQIPLYLAGYGMALFVVCALPAAATKRLSSVSVLVAGVVGAVVFAVAFYAVVAATAGAFRLGLGAAFSGESDTAIGFWFGSPVMLLITALFVPMAVAIALDGERQVPAVTVVLRFTIAGIATMALLFALIDRNVAPSQVADVDAVLADDQLLFQLGLVGFFGLAMLFSLLPSREATRYAEARGARIGAGYLVSAGATKAITAVIVFAFVVYNGVAIINGIEVFSIVRDLVE